MKRSKTLLALPALGLAVLAGCGDDANDAGSGSPAATEAPVEASAAPAADGEIALDDVSARAPVPGTTNGAVYATITNGTDRDIRIVAATSPASDNVQLHETVEAEAGMKMQQVEGFDVPAGGSFAFESGGPHIMLMDVDADTFPTDEVEVTLELDQGDPVTFTAEVSSPTGDEMDHEDMDHEDMEIDAGPLHDLDEALAAGTLDVEPQRAVVADYLAHYEALEPAAASPEADLLSILEALDAALEAEDVGTAADAAARAHTALHDLGH